MQCPQCGSARAETEMFCDSCGHKYVDPPTPEQSKSDISTEEQSPKQSSDMQGTVYFQNVGGEDAFEIHFAETPLVIQRQDVSDFLRSQGLDPLQFSRKQCTLYREGSDYYIEDGVTSVQDKSSGNHTVVNGRDITGKGKTMLSNGDHIRFASMVDAVFRTE